MGDNVLYWGDNLDVLRRYIPTECVDLIYLDPPFQSGRDYNVIFREPDGSRDTAEIKAFGDTWRWDTAAAATYDGAVSRGGKLADTLEAFRKILGTNDMLAYLSMMAPRLVELDRVLKRNGSIYLHCDPTASHCLKILMDAVFGVGGFRSEVIWSYRRWPNPPTNYQHMHDVILYYCKGDKPTFNATYEAASDSFLKRFKGKANRLEPGETRKRATEKETPGMPIRDVWELSIIAPASAERMGYPTQKPLSLLERIVSISSNEGDVVLDPFCGCGTTIDAAHALKRTWIGIDITHLAIGLIKSRLQDRYGEAVKADYKVIGEPTTLSGAVALAKEDKHQFEHWALGLVGARHSAKSKGADRGIDGVLRFQEGGAPGSPFQSVILSVKSGGVEVKDIRDLVGVITREEAAIGALLTLEEPTGPMKREAASAGFYTSPWGKHPKIQIRTIQELLGGARLDMPPLRQVDRTHARAHRHRPASYQHNLALSEPPEDEDLPL